MPFPDEKIEITITSVQGGKKGKYTLKESVGRWFNADGVFIGRDFKRDFESYLSNAVAVKKS